jgi:type IV secretory pathway TraG/TraD family ATPase VirD4
VQARRVQGFEAKNPDITKVAVIVYLTLKEQISEAFRAWLWLFLFSAVGILFRRLNTGFRSAIINPLLLVLFWKGEGIISQFSCRVESRACVALVNLRAFVVAVIITRRTHAREKQRLSVWISARLLGSANHVSRHAWEATSSSSESCSCFIPIISYVCFLPLRVFYHILVFEVLKQGGGSNGSAAAS